MTAAFLGGILLGAVILLGLVIWSIRRHRDPDLHIECDSPIDELIPTLAGLTLGTAVAGNTANVLENGAFFDVLIDRIHAARESVHFETFLWKEGVLGHHLDHNLRAFFVREFVFKMMEEFQEPRPRLLHLFITRLDRRFQIRILFLTDRGLLNLHPNPIN